MLVLGIETTTKTCSVGLTDGHDICSEVSLHLGFSHSEKLIALIDDLLRKNKKKVKDLGGVAVSIGPGSFTGIRVGVSAARALGQSLDILLVGIPSLDGLAFGVGSENELVCPLIDALRGEVYTALYHDGKRLTALQLVGINEWLAELKSRKENILFLGEGVDIYEGLIKEKFGQRARIADREKRYASGKKIAQMGWNELNSGNGKNYGDVLPLYIRRAEAEVKWEQKERMSY